MKINENFKKLSAFAVVFAGLCSFSFSAFSEPIAPVLDDDAVTECVTSEEPQPEIPDDADKQISAPVWADVNGDDKFNVTDLSLVCAHVKGIKPLDDPSAADVSGDGKVNVIDVVKIAFAVKRQII